MDHNKCEAMNGPVSLAVSISPENFARQSKPIMGIFEFEKNSKINRKELNQADNWFCSRGYEINYAQQKLVVCKFCNTEWRLFDV